MSIRPSTFPFSCLCVCVDRAIHTSLCVTCLYACPFQRRNGWLFNSGRISGRTFHQGGYRRPGLHGTATEVLAQRQLQVEQRNTTRDQGEEVWYQEYR